jgi:hypothetical protein
MARKSNGELKDAFVFAKKFICAYENADKEPEKFQLYLNFYKHYFQKVLPNIPEIKKYKKIFYKYFRSSDKWQREEEAIIKEIIVRRYIAIKKWLKSNKIFISESFKEIAIEIIRDRIRKIQSKEKTGFEADTFNYLTSLEQDSLLTKHSQESRKDSIAEKETIRNYKMALYLLSKITQNLNKKYGKPAKRYDWQKELKKDIKKNLSDYQQSKSVFSVAKEIPIDFRKLLYTLKKIYFPLAKIKTVREGNFIIKSYLPLFYKLLPSLKLIWKQEKTFKEWVNYLKKIGWEKSRISKFISRRIKSGVVPPLFFETFLPDKELFDMVKNKNVALDKSFRCLPGNEEILYNKKLRYKNQLEQIKHSFKPYKNPFAH